MKITVSRDKSRFGVVRKLKLYVDAEHLFDIKSGEQMIVDIPPNAKTIQGKMDWQKTNLLSLENIKEGEQIKIEGHKAHRSVLGSVLDTLNPFSAITEPMPIRLRIH